MQNTLITPVAAAEPAVRETPSVVSTGGMGKVETGLGAWATAISGDDNAQAAIALAEAINRARNSQASREHRAVDARVIAVSRLETLRARLAPVYAAIPRDVELFDLGMVGHSPPRLFVDIIAYVEMQEDQKGFRLVQETRTGRVVLGETTDEKQMTALVTDYIAERLVDRERALAVQGFHLKPQPLPRAISPVTVAPVGVAPEPARKRQEARPEPAESVVDKGEAPSETQAAIAASPVKDVAAAASSLGARITQAAAEGVSTVAASSAKISDAAAATAEPAMATSRSMASSTGLTPKALASTVGVATAASASAASRMATPPARATTAVAQQSSSWFWPLLALLIGIGLGALALYLYAANLARP